MKKIVLILFALYAGINAMAQVNYATGSATFNLPMFNWQDDKSRLLANIGLSYNSGNGLKVNTLASNVGQGWDLLAGGVITRLQAGEPDDQLPRDGAVEDVTKYPPGYIYNTISPASGGCPTALTKYPIFGDQNHIYKQHNTVAADRELDRFAFQMNGKSGMFYLDMQNPGKGRTLEHNNLKIWYTRNESNPSSGIRTTIVAFYIQDDNGLIYKFSNYELTKTLVTNYCDANRVGTRTQPNFKGGKVYHESAFNTNELVNPYVINSWYLAEITDPLTNRKIVFNYHTRVITNSVAKSITYYKEKNYSIISHGLSITNTPVLNNITFPDGHQVNLFYEKDRVDLPGDKALSAVDIMYRGRYMSRFKLITSYFIYNRYGIPVTDYQKRGARLCLQAVKRVGPDLKMEDQPYLFDYYLGSGVADDFVPPPFSHIKDIWGYYNGDFSQSASSTPVTLTKPITELSNDELKGLCFQRNNSTDLVLNAKPGYAKNGLLKQVTYPAGGTLKYTYAQNQTFNGSQNVNTGGVHVSSTSVTDDGFSNNCNNPIVTNYYYRVSETNQQSSLKVFEAPRNSISMSSHYAPERRYFYYKPVLNLGCDWSYKYPGILAREQAVSLTSAQKFLNTLSKVMNVVSSVLQVVDIVSLCLKATPAAWVAVILDVIGVVFGIVFSCTQDISENSYTTIYYNSDINASNPLPSVFTRLEIVEGNGSNGRTEMEFTSPENEFPWEPDNPSLSMRQRYAHWAAGLTKKTTIKDASGNPVKQTEHVYAMRWEGCVAKCNDPAYVPNASCKCLVLQSYSQRNTDWQQPAFYNANYIKQSSADLLVGVYGMYSGHAEVMETYERTFKPGSSTQFQETVSQYNYGTFSYLLSSISVRKSNGDRITKSYQYTYDVNEGVLATLKQNNIVTELVSVYTYVAHATGGTSGLLNELVNEYAVLGNGNIKPYRTLERRFDTPDPIFITYRYPGSPDNPTGYKETSNLTYDALGNLVGMKDEGGRAIASIYDYNDKYIVASVVNATLNIDKPTYTSFETTGLGGWALAGSATYVTNNATTGSRSLQMTASNSLTATLNTAKPYILSFWSLAPLTVNGGATLLKSGPQVHGFTYYEYAIAQGTGSVGIAGSAIIDEVRLYPQSARMRTLTYDPILGKTAECDENNRITYYEYESLGRLRFIRDDKDNILKMYEYNYAINKPDGCTITYSNHAVTEMIARNNCGPDYLGGEISYTIPAGKYTSTISQAVVDMMVEMELLTLGQIAANTQAACIQIHYNDEKSQTFTKQSCPLGYIGGTYTYVVPARKYSSLISKEAANELAQEEIDANGQAEANRGNNATCTINTEPIYEGTGNEDCRNGLIYREYIDVNPNSPGFGGPPIWVRDLQSSCPITITCRQYNIEVPNTFTGDLWVTYTVCGSPGSVTKSYFRQMPILDNGNSTSINLCLSGPPQFRIGQSGPIQVVPGVTVTPGATCNP